MRKLLMAAGVMLGLAWPDGGARAAVLQYSVQGVFANGDALSGGFSLNSAVALPASVFGSTLKIDRVGSYGTFLGAHAAAGTVGGLDIEFFGVGILSLGVLADFDLGTGLVQDFRNGMLGDSSLYAAGAADMVLSSGNIFLVAESGSIWLLGSGVVLAMGVGFESCRRHAVRGPRMAVRRSPPG